MEQGPIIVPGGRGRWGRLKAAFLVAAVCAWAAGVAWAEIPTYQESLPDTLNYQGTLHQADGTPMAGPVTVEIAVYDQAAGGTPLWTETHQQVPLFEGVFNVVLGETSPGLAKIIGEHADLWIGVRVSGGEEYSPRQRITAVPFAFSAQAAVDALHGLPPGTVLPFGGPLERIPYGWLPCDGQPLSTETHPEYGALWAAIGTAWGGTGPGNFKTPNFGGRTLIGAGAGPNLSDHAVGDLLGEENTKLEERHLPPHTHTYTDTYSAGPVTYLGGWSWNVARLDWVSHSRTTDYEGGSGGQTVAHNTMQPSAAVNFIIKY
jgi:microcystin-dependent protein